MSGTTLLRNSALVALAAATVVLPSVGHAQDRGREDLADHGGGEHRGGGGNGGGGDFNRGQAPQQAAPQQQMQRPQPAPPQAQVQAQGQAEGQAQRGWQGRYQGQQAVPQPGAGWQGRYQGQAQVQQTVPAQHQDRGQDRGQNPGQPPAQYQGRNQGYVDPQRNRDNRGEQRNVDRHDGDRRDGDRHDGDRRGGWQNGQGWGGQGHGNFDRGNQDRGNQYRGNQYQGREYHFGQQQTWRNDWRRDQRYNWQGYRSQNRNVFRGGRYYAPYNGYSYRQLGIGFFLDQAFFGENYWIGNPEYYRLPPAYGPYRWVRYYDDVLLVNIYTGEVVDEIHDFYW